MDKTQKKVEIVGDIVENAVPPIDYLTLDGEILLINPVRAESLGGQPADFIGKSIYDVQPDMADETKARIERVVKTNTCHEFVDEVRYPAGSDRRSPAETPRSRSHRRIAAGSSYSGAVASPDTRIRATWPSRYSRKAAASRSSRASEG